MKKLLLLLATLLSVGTAQLQASLLGAPKTELSGRVGPGYIDVKIDGGTALIYKSPNGEAMTSLLFDKNGICQLVGLFNANLNSGSAFDTMEQMITGTDQWESVPANLINGSLPGFTYRFSVSNGTYMFATAGIETIDGRPYVSRLYTSKAGIALAGQLKKLATQLMN